MMSGRNYVYSFDERCAECWDENWKQSDDFFFDNPTNSNLVAPKNYESVGFVLHDQKENNDEAAFSGDYLYYRIQLCQAR